MQRTSEDHRWDVYWEDGCVTIEVEPKDGNMSDRGIISIPPSIELLEEIGKAMISIAKEIEE